MKATFPEPLWALPTWAMEATERYERNVLLCDDCCRHMRLRDDVEVRVGDSGGYHYCELCRRVASLVYVAIAYKYLGSGPRLTVVLDGPMLGEVA